MNRRLDDLQALATMAAANMRPTSIAMVLGRPTAWVERQLAALEAAAAAEPAIEAAPVGQTPGELPGPSRLADLEAAAFFEQLLADIGGQLGLTYDQFVAWTAPTWVGPARGHVDPVREPAPAAVPPADPKEPAHARPSRPSSPRLPSAAALEPEADAPARQAARARPAGVRAVPGPGAPLAKDAALAQGVRRLKPVSANVVRFARWFVAARWPLGETAELFDIDPDALAQALGLGAAA